MDRKGSEREGDVRESGDRKGKRKGTKRKSEGGGKRIKKDEIKKGTVKGSEGRRGCTSKGEKIEG